MRLSALDPRVKLALMLLATSAALLLKSPLKMLCLMSLLLGILLLGRTHLRQIGGKMRPVLGLIAGLFVLQCVFVRSGPVVWQCGQTVLLTAHGLQAAALVGLRLLILLLSALLLATSPLRDYLLAFTQIHIPYEIAFMVLAAMRFLPMLREEAQDVLAVVQMRGTKLKKTGLRHKMNVYLKITLPILSGAIKKAERMALAMEMRAFRALPHRTSMRRLSFNRRDILYLCGVALCILAIAAV